MKKRTLEELHDAKIGHRKFAKICDLLIEKGYSITDIKEYYEKFIFFVDGSRFEYSKVDWKSSAKEFADYVIDMVETIKQIRRFEYWR